MANMADKPTKEIIMENVHERDGREPKAVETTAPIGAAGTLVGRSLAWLSEMRSWRVVVWWVAALLALSGVMLLFYTFPAYAQAEGIDTCGGGGNVGGEGGAAILNAIKNLALFGAALIAGASVLGLLASGLAIILGSASKDWQRRGASGIGYAFLGIFIALAAGAIYSVLQWAICG